MTTIPKSMIGVLLLGHGGLDQLSYSEDIPLPDIGSNDVLIRVEAAGVNNTDINTRTAWYSKGGQKADDASWSGEPLSFPRIQGADACGVIVKTGAAVSIERIGERVLIEPCLQYAQGKKLNSPWYFGSECDGGFAGFTVVDARHAYEVDSLLTSVELASFPCSYSTAENMLTRAAVGPDDRVLITGASGGVGSAAIQLAKVRGAKVVAATRPAKFESLRSIGADEVIAASGDYSTALGANSIDVVIDLVAGNAWPSLLEVLRPGGRYAIAGAIGGADVNLDVRTLYLKDLSFFGCTVLEPEVFGNLIRIIESGAIKPIVAETFELVDIAVAQTAFLEKKHTGKIVITVSDGG